jgi:hypothetical protein
MKVISALRFLALCCLFLGSTSPASTTIGVNLGEVVWIAESIYAGTVSDTICTVSEDGMSVTEYHFSNVIAIKTGQYGASGRLRLVGTPPSNVTGQPSLEIGARYVVFSAPELYSSGRGRGAIVGLDQGLYRVGTDYRGSAGVILDSRGRPVVEVKGRHVVVVGSDAAVTQASNRFRAELSKDLPPRRPKDLPPAAPPHPSPSTNKLRTDHLPPSMPPRPPDPPELPHIRERWESRPRGAVSEPTVEILERTDDTGRRITENEFLQVIRGLLASSK